MAVPPARNDGGPIQYVAAASADLANIVNPKLGELALVTGSGGSLWFHNGSAWTQITSGGGGSVATDTIYDAKGDLPVGTGADTAQKLTVGADDTIIMADSSTATGLKYVAAGSPQAVSTAGADGTADTFSRGDHVHAHETSHVVHDTAWNAKGDLMVASANDTASAVTVGADDTILMADSAQANGVKWVASASPSAVGTAAATGTADTFTRGDHVHAHETAHVAHDTIFDATGDLVVGTGADTAAKLSIGTTGQVLGGESTNGAYWQAPWQLGWAPSAALAESYPRIQCAAGNLNYLTSGTLFLQLIYLPRGMTITSISFVSGTTALVSGTNQWFALYNTSRVLLRQTNDDTSTAWGTNTVKTLNLTSSYQTTAGGPHYLAIMVAASTVPTLKSAFGAPSTNTLNNLTPISVGSSNTGLAGTAPDPCNALTVTANGIPYAYVS